MVEKIVKSKIDGLVAAPASKSFSQRALAAAMLAKGESQIFGMGLCGDSEAVISVLKCMGAVVTLCDEHCTVLGCGVVDGGKTINIGESGLATRLFAPISSLCSNKIVIEGHGSILSRPMTIVEQPLKELGVEVESSNGYLPLSVKGPLMGGEITVDASLSSQFLSGLLIALPLAKGDSIINISKLNSTPYIDMTLITLKAFGIEIENDNYKRFLIKGSQSYRPTSYKIEGDWSGASALLVAGATSKGKITITNLNPDSKQADRAILDALKVAGANVEIGESSVTVKDSLLNGFEFDATHCPDLFPALAVLAAHAKGVTTLKGAERLRHKESDRAAVLCELMDEFGISAKCDGDIIIIKGGKPKGGISVDSRNDHRIAMAAAVMALSCDSEVEITCAEAVGKSYPAFWEDIKKLTIK